MDTAHSAPPRRGVALALTLAVALALGLTAKAGAQEEAPAGERPAKLHFQIPRIATPIKIDGVLDDPAWSEALAMDVNNEMNPGKNIPAPVTMITYLAYDDNNLYAAFRANDPDPSAIRANLTDRDAAFGDDFVGLILDTFNDERRGFELFVNPLGVQMDLALNEMVQPEEDAAWDAIWDAAGRIDEQGFVVEMAVPFSSLRFQRTDGEQTWGIGPFRAYPRRIRHHIAAMQVDPDDECFVCQMPKVTGFAGVTPGHNITLEPTATAQRTDRRDDFPQGSLEDGDEEGELGLTARWGVTPNLTFSGAVNPDFSQVEADAVELDLNTRFALFFPEKRPFFLEGADFFQTPIAAIYTRTVADPSWGVKLTGKEGKNAVGVFVAEDDQTNLLVPGNQFSRFAELPGTDTTDAVVRYRRDLGTSSTLGALVTHREGSDYLNSVVGIDGRWKPNASNVFTVQALGSRSEYPDAFGTAFGLPDGQLEGSALRGAYNYDSRTWSAYALWEDIDEEFRADLGFLPKVGHTVGLAGLRRTWWATDRTRWTSFALGAEWDQTDAEDGTVLEREVEGFARFQGPYQSLALLGGGRRDRFWNGVTFDETFVNVTLQAQPSAWLAFNIQGTLGDTIDFAHTRAADLLRIRPSVTLKLGQHIEAGLDHDRQRVEVDGGELQELNVTQLRTVYQLNIRTFVRAIFQYTDLETDLDLFTAYPLPADDEHLFTQLLFSYKLNPTTVLFLGYSDNQLGGQLFDGTRLDLTRNDRTFFLKVGYALVF